MMQVEVEMGFKMLPDIAKNTDNVKVFSDKEQYADLIENGKYNKKQGKSHREKISHILQ